jgi:ABC-type sugar transport system substrate-binding protein
MSKLKELEQLLEQGKITRRSFIASLSALGFTAALSPVMTNTSAFASKHKLKGWGPLQGVAQKPDGSPYKIAHVSWALNNDFPITMDKIIQSLTKRAGGEFISLDPDNSLEKQISMFEDLATRGVDAIIFLPVDSEGVVPTIEKLTKKGIHFFNVDHKAETDATTSFATHDQVDCGRVGAKYLVEWAKKKGKKLTVFEIWGKMGHEGSERRHQGYHEIFKKNPDVIAKVIESPDTGWMTDKAMQFAMEALPAHPEINAICTHNNMVPGVVEALRAIKRLYPIDHPEHVPYVGIDCFPVAMEHLRNGFCDGIAVHSPWEEADAAFKCAMLKVCCGLDVPKLVNFDSYLITRDNIDSVRFGAPAVWGDMWSKYPDFDEWPVLEIDPKYGVPTPTVKMKKPGY